MGTHLTPFSTPRCGPLARPRTGGISPHAGYLFLSPPTKNSHTPDFPTMPTFSIYTATMPSGRIMQLWGTPSHNFPELIATDYPDPDVCDTNLIISTPSYTEAWRTFQAHVTTIQTTANALGTSVHIINPED